MTVPVLAAGTRDNLRGSLLMMLAMALFAIEDMLIKLMATSLPVGQILVFLGASGALLFGAAALVRGERLWSRDLWHRGVVIRNAGEVIGTVGIVTAIALTPLSSASAILQAMPLAITLGAALFLGERVGWRRWSAIGIGFAGVLLVVRPGMAGFDPLSLFAVLGVVGLATRDIGTRLVPARITSIQLSAYALILLVPAGAAMMALRDEAWVRPEGWVLAWLVAAMALGGIAYVVLVTATRLGEVGAVAPFRYSRIVFALAIGIWVFGERPDAATLLGAAVIVGSGLYTFWRETALARAQARSASQAGPRGL
ncbi:MAG: DMT family transporter [Rubellimicrobium sp.]|nr:DMT family transporter [Rubellimicrobium sp.]